MKIMNLTTSALVVILSCVSCLSVSHEESWAPVTLNLDRSVVHPAAEAYVYVDGDYRANTIDGRLRVYLTLEAHDVEVHIPGFEVWERSVFLSTAEYPKGRVIQVTPSREAAASN
ncbi:MAG: hypothetical protein ACI8X5_000451 [Planctomycetota bacterium]|jgi:hypothetical protein